jgi:hypothetical protein
VECADVFRFCEKWIYMFHPCFTARQQKLLRLALPDVIGSFPSQPEMSAPLSVIFRRA